VLRLYRLSLGQFLDVVNVTCSQYPLYSRYLELS